MPPDVLDALDFFAAIFNFEFDAWNIHFNCYGLGGLYWQIAFLMIWPVIAIVFTPLVGLALALLFKQTTLRELWALGRRRGERSFLDVIFLRYCVPLMMLIRG